MAKKKNSDSRLENLPKKLASTLEKLCFGDNSDGVDFLDKAQQASKEELDKMIVQFNENLVDFRKDMEADTDLESKKTVYQEAAAVYRDGIKANEAKAMYCIILKRSL